MTSIDELEQLVNNYEQRINELKRLETVLNELNTKGFKKETISIKQKLKDPKAVDQVRNEINDLKSKITSEQQTPTMTPSNEKIQDIKDRIDTLKSKNADIIIDDIEKMITDGKVKQALTLLNQREESFNDFSNLNKKLNTIKSKIRKLTDRVADGELDSEAYKRALDDFETQKKTIEEKLWKLRNSLFKDEYEKPF